LRDVAPALIVTVNSTWMVFTRRYMLAIQNTTWAKGNANDVVTQVTRWAQGMRLTAFECEHLPLASLATLGLIMWSVGVPISTSIGCH